MSWGEKGFLRVCARNVHLQGFGETSDLPVHLIVECANE